MLDHWTTPPTLQIALEDHGEKQENSTKSVWFPCPPSIQSPSCLCWLKTPQTQSLFLLFNYFVSLKESHFQSKWKVAPSHFHTTQALSSWGVTHIALNLSGSHQCRESPQMWLLLQRKGVTTDTGFAPQRNLQTHPHPNKVFDIHYRVLSF